MYNIEDCGDEAFREDIDEESDIDGTNDHPFWGTKRWFRETHKESLGSVDDDDSVFNESQRSTPAKTSGK